MATKRCAVFDEAGDDEPCGKSVTMVRTVFGDSPFPTASYYCAEHGDVHGAVLMEVALVIRGLRARALSDKDGWHGHLLVACDRALLGDERAVEECMDAIADEKTWAPR